MMLSIQNNINTYKYSKPAKINFKGEKEDETAKLLKALQRENLINNDNFYSKVNNDIDMNEAQKILKRRIRIMPLLMDQLMIDTDRYISKETDSDTFSRTFIDDSAPFYKRIQLGKNKEVYTDNYRPEINMINTIIERCVNFRKELATKTQLDDTIEKALDAYAKTSRQGIKHFTI